MTTGSIFAWAIGIGLLSAAGGFEVRNQRLGPDAPPIWRLASLLLAAIGLFDMIVAIVLGLN
jgi:hypothetical protein